MRRIWLSDVIDGDADEPCRLIEMSAIEIDVVIYFASDLSCFVGRAHTTLCCRVDGGYGRDVDAGVRGIVPHRFPRCYSGHRGACGEFRCSADHHIYLGLKACPRDLAVDAVSPHPHR